VTLLTDIEATDIAKADTGKTDIADTGLADTGLADTGLAETGLADGAAVAAKAATTIYVCVTCRRPGDADDAPRPGATLAAMTESAADGRDVIVRRVRCLANCKRGCSAAVRRDGAWTYVFGDLDATSAGAALVEGAQLFAQSTDGLMPWRGRPEPLKRGLVARVPPIDFTEDTE
jgi:predicted metal-binding protein